MANEMYLSTAPDQWVPELAGSYADQAMAAAAVAYRVSTLQPISATKIRIPVYTKDPASAWVAEGATLDVEAADLDGIDVEPKTVAVLSKISRQFFDDQGQLSTAIIEGQGRDIGYKIDAALFGSNAGQADQPSGLEDLTGVKSIDAGTAWTDLDTFAEAKLHAEQLGETIDNFVAHPDDALSLSTLKDETDSVRPLIGGTAQAGATTVLGVPLLVSDAVTSGTVWGLPKRHVVLVQRNQVVSEVDTGVYFGSLSLALRSFARVGFAFTRPAAVCKVSLDTAGS